MANQSKTASSSQPKPGMAPKMRGGAGSGVGRLAQSKMAKGKSGK